jgi:O-antigen/teichoic acid export membrane protein
VFNQIKQLIRHSCIYGITNILNKAIGLVLIPLYTRYLTPGDYGILEIFTVSASFVLIVMQLGMGSALFRSFLYKENAQKKVLISSSFYFLTFASFLLFVILWIFSDLFSSIIFKSLEYVNILKLVFLTSFLNNIGTIALAKLRIESASLKYSIIAISKFSLQLLLSIYFVAVLKRGIEGIIIAGVITAGVSGVIFIGLLIKDLGFIFSKEEIKDMLGFGLPLVPAGIAASLLTMADRFFLKFYSTPYELGIYSVGYKFGMIIVLITGAFQTAWPTVMFSIAKDKRANFFYARVLTYFLFIISFIVLGLSIFSKEILKIFTVPEFYEAYKVIPLIAISYALSGGYFVTAVGFNLKKKTHYQALTVIVGAGINIILNFILIPPYGMMGAAFATLISYLFIFVTATKISLHFYPISYEKLRILKIILTGFLLYCPLFFTHFGSTVESVGIKLILLFSYPFILYLMRFYKEDELKKIKEIAGRIKEK